ncbi:mas-related G-protein coupled receptor member X2-like [Myotis yumanensis]|uniref:mas-related G-protein coupled receptor member X2-like n=1 Tax=Myotis yumanensis TaxID=159337 RepID=UPI0038D35B2D
MRINFKSSEEISSVFNYRFHNSDYQEDDRMAPGAKLLFSSRVTTAGFESTNMTVTAWGTELTSTNGSDQALAKWNKATLTPAVLICTVALVGLAGNAVVLWLLGFRMRRNAFSVYILNLAGADFLFLCYQFTRSLYFMFNFPFFISVLNRALSPVSTCAYISGLSFLSAISTERCLSVLWPIWYRCRRPRHLSTIMCALLWALSLLLSILEKKFSWSLLHLFSPSMCQVFDFIIAAWLILLFVLLSGSSLALMTRLLCGSNRVPPTRLYMTVVITVLVFLLCGLPFGINWFIIFWITNKFNAFIDLSIPVELLSCVNSCANPIIYFFVGSFRQRWWKQRHTLRLVLQRALQDTPEVDEPGESLPGETLAMSGGSLGQG